MGDQGRMKKKVKIMKKKVKRIIYEESGCEELDIDPNWPIGSKINILKEMDYGCPCCDETPQVTVTVQIYIM